MSARNKLLIPILILTMLVVAGSVAAYQAFGGMGTLVVDVHEKMPGGDLVHIEIPAVLIPITMLCVPDHAFIECHADDEDMRYAGPIMRAVSRELQKMPDTEIVSVETSDEFVSIIKEGNNIIVDVDTREETVHVSIPIRAMESVSKKMEKVIRNST
jgi:hypothetical protein